MGLSPSIKTIQMYKHCNQNDRILDTEISNVQVWVKSMCPRHSHALILWKSSGFYIEFLVKICCTMINNCSISYKNQQCDKNKSVSVLATWFTLKYVILTFLSHIFEELDCQNKMNFSKIFGHFYKTWVTNEWHKIICSLHIGRIHWYTRKLWLK